MLRRSRRALTEPGTVLLVATDPLVIAAARDAAQRMAGPPPVLLATDREALGHLVGPGLAPRHLVLEGGRGLSSPALLSALRDPFSGTGVVVVRRPGTRHPSPAGLRHVDAEGSKLADALIAGGTPGEMPPGDVAALAAGLDRGEITVRFQPMVRMADRRPVLVEALARWERPAAPLGADRFIPMAEREGLATRLTRAVARRALRELAALPGASGLRMSFNVPLAVLVEGGMAAWLAREVATAGLQPERLLLELTESTEVRDTALLRRALVRLGRQGFGVLLDDLGLDDKRRRLLDLPFAGVKLDRKLVLAMPHDRRARATVEGLVAQARRRGMVVVAEGVTDTLTWRAAASAGCDVAQGFGVGRPVPPPALPAWISAWRASLSQA
jgi:EAL domain-containing protein (putative c-di-GMP-specific phosphodiesterase class I)